MPALRLFRLLLFLKTAEVNLGQRCLGEFASTSLSRFDSLKVSHLRALNIHARVVDLGHTVIPLENFSTFREQEFGIVLILVFVIDIVVVLLAITVKGSLLGQFLVEVLLGVDLRIELIVVVTVLILVDVFDILMSLFFFAVPGQSTLTAQCRFGCTHIYKI